MARLIRVSLKGDMAGGEVWSVNPVYSVGGDFGAPVSAAQAATIAAGIDALTISAGLSGMWNPGTRLLGCRVEARAINGDLEALADHVRGTPVNGAATGAMPFQTSLVSSLRTTKPGPSGRGRLYWPATGVPLVLANNRPSAANMTTYLAAIKTTLSAVQGVIDVTFDGVALVVWSRKLSTLFTVNSIQTGDVLDVQRRRRDAEVENYNVLAYP